MGPKITKIQLFLWILPPYPGRAESTESPYFGIFLNLAKILNFSVVSVDSALPG